MIRKPALERLPLLAAAFSLAILLLAFACGKRAEPSAADPVSTSPAATPALDAQPSGASFAANRLARVIRDINAYKPAENADANVISKLKSALRAAILARAEVIHAGRVPSAAPSGDGGRVTDLAYFDATSTLTWTYKNTGDYDVSGEVGVSDITPIALHFLAPVGADALLGWIDGDGSGEVGVSDITPVAMNYLSNVAAYQILTMDTASAPGTEIGRVAFDPGQAGFPRTFGTPVPAGALRYVRVCPLDANDAAGAVSNAVEVNPPPPGPPVIVSVSPIAAVEGDSVTFGAVVTGSVPTSYAWDFGGGVTPNTDATSNPLVTVSAAGTYNCSLSVVSPGGNDSFPFTLTVDPAPPQQLELWYWSMQNLYVDANLAPELALAQRAANAGYTTLAISDYKFAITDLMDQHYRDNVTSFTAQARAMGLEVVPSLVPIGYSDAYCQHDPNLIEGQPVVDALFQASGGVADVIQDAAMTNGDFENHMGDNFPGWVQMDNPGVETFADTSVFHGGGASMRFENFTADSWGHDRIRQALNVTPWNCYVIRFWLKTENVSPRGFNFFCFNKDFSKTLSFLNFNTSATQDWTEYFLQVNSQDTDQLQLYMGMWGGVNGRFWIDDVSIENAGLINLIRRGGAPLTVKNQAGTITYTEGADFFAVSDPAMGHAGSWPGTYDLYHARPVISLTPGSGISNGDTLKVSYYHAAFVLDMQPAVCLTEPAVDDITRTTLTDINTLMNPAAVLIGIDEMRSANWCALCQAQGKTPGGLLADMTARIDAIANSVNPAWKLITWSDMYDPDHNAHADYYLVNGTLANSWDGLPADWDIGNWYYRAGNDATLAFFDGRGNRQILCGYYDEGAVPIYYITDWLQQSINYPGVYAVMYTTWQKDYSQLEAWAGAVREWESQQPK